MKNRLTFALFLLCCPSIFSQQISFPITYNVTLNIVKDKSDHHNNPSETLYEESFLNSEGKRNSKTITHTRFYPDMMDKVLEYFVKHIEVNKKVKNYFENTYYSGIPQLTRTSMKKMIDPTLYAKWGGYYLNLESSDISWVDGKAKGKYWNKEIMIGYEGVFDCAIVQQQDSYPPYDVQDVFICTPLGSDFVEGLGFSEFWNFDPENGEFIKDVRMLSLRQFILDQNTAELRGVMSILNFTATSKKDTTQLFRKNMEYDVFFDNWNYCNLFSGDGSCENIKNEASSGSTTLNAISPLSRAELLKNILKAIEEGKLVAIDPTSFENKDQKKLSVEQVYEWCFTTRDSAYVQYPYPPYDEYMAVYSTSTSLAEIIGIKFIEDWSFDPVSFNFHKKVKYFALLSSYVNRNTGELIGYQPLVYLKTKN